MKIFLSLFLLALTSCASVNPDLRESKTSHNRLILKNLGTSYRLAIITVNGVESDSFWLRPTETKVVFLHFYLPQNQIEVEYRDDPVNPSLEEFPR